MTTDWVTGVRYRADAKGFSASLCVHATSKVHQDSYPMGIGGYFPGVKRGRGVMLTNLLFIYIYIYIFIYLFI
jgi:hypothetical protein